MDSPYITGFYFSLSFEGLAGKGDAAFQEASGLSKEAKLEEITSGGENRFKFRVPTSTSFQNLVLKRGVAATDSPLLEWCAQVLDSGLGEPIKTRNVQLNLLDEKGSNCSTWTFENAYPVKWSATDLKSQDNAMLIESLEFAYHYFDIGLLR